MTLSLLVGFLIGGCWALIAALLKSYWNISEIIVTIMLNYIAINLVGLSVRTFLMDPAGNVPQSPQIASSVRLGYLIPTTRLHVGVLLAVVCVIVAWFLMSRTTLGFELRAVGANRRAALCNGMPVVRSIVLSALLSGGLAGLAGGIEVLAIQGKLIEGFSSGYGYTAVLVALVAGNNPLGTAAVGTVYAALSVGAGSMQRLLGVPSSIVSILIGLLVILVLGKELIPSFFQARRDKDSLDKGNPKIGADSRG